MLSSSLRLPLHPLSLSNTPAHSLSLSPSQTTTNNGRPHHARFLTRKTLLTRAQAGDGESTQTVTSPDVPDATSAAPKKKSVIRRVRKAEPENQGADVSLQMKSLEDPSVSYEGVVRLDKGAGLSLGQLAILAAGDALALVVFSYIGRATHVSAAVDFELLKTAMPFITGWIISAVIWGEYSPSRPLPRSFQEVAGSTAKPWAVGVPIGVVIRSALKGAAPQVPFVIVSMVSTAVIVTAWRYAFFNLVVKDDGEASGESSVSKSGTVFEFFELLTSLVRRW